MVWADEVRTLGVRANAETPLDAAQARKFGAEGIGLCRTEHMFFEGDRIVAVRQMILADDEKGRRAALAKIQPMQRQDFVELFEIMAGLPVTIRLLDPPLHEFLPKTHADMEVVAKDLGVDGGRDRGARPQAARVQPHAGPSRLRLGISYPGDLRDAGARHLRGRGRGAEEGGQDGDPRDHDPAGRDAEGARPDEGGGRPGRGRGQPAVGPEARIPGRHHDRAAARGAAGRRDRRDRPTSSASAPTT